MVSFTSVLFVVTAVPLFVLALPRPAPEAPNTGVVWHLYKTPSMNTSMVKRDPNASGLPICIPESGTELVGNGNPHQNALTLRACGLYGRFVCSVSQIDSYTIAYAATGTLGTWITGGFSVTESTTTGQSYTCNGNAGDTICIIQNIAHTAYTVRNWSGTDCAPLQGEVIVVQSPNVNNAGGYFWCGKGSQCGTIGHEWWDLTEA